MYSNLPFGTKVELKPGGRHEILIGYLFDKAKVAGGGARYSIVCPTDLNTRGVIRARVYDDEIAAVVGLNEPETVRLIKAS